MHSKRKGLVVLLVVSTFVVLLGSTASARTWGKEAVYAPKTFTFHKRAIALDSMGYPHMVYGGDYLYWAHFDGSAWSSETVDPSPAVGSHASLAIDASDNIHIAYFDARNGKLKYATNAPGSWAIETPDPFPHRGIKTSIVLDSSGYVHIAYFDTAGGSHDVRYATNASGSWQLELVGSFHWQYYVNSIAIDSSDQVYICFTDSVGNLTIATRVSGSWDLTAIDVGTEPSISVDAFDHLHIAYAFGKELKYATNASGDWVISSLTLPEDPAWITLALGPSDEAYITYSPQLDSFIKYVTRAGDAWGGPFSIVEGILPTVAIDSAGHMHLGYKTEEGLNYANDTSGSWETATVDISGNVGDSSVAVDPSDKIHISFGTKEGLKYTTNASGDWVLEDIDPNGGYSSIAADSSGHAHVSYCEEPLYRLKYATNASGSWVSTTIDSEWQVGRLFNYIALDSAGYIHIYYSAAVSAGSYLRYATNESGSWVWSNVDTLDYGTIPTTIAVDSSGHAHVCYFDDTGTPKYATNSSGSWVRETLPFSADHLADIALDPLGYPHLAYTLGGAIMHATNAGGSWTTEPIGADGENVHIAVDRSGKIHMGFLERPLLDVYLKYAVKVYGAWEIETVDPEAGSGPYSCLISMAVDSLGRAHMSYRDYLNVELKCASSGVWVTFTVDTAELVRESSTAIALDSTDGLHLSYQTWSSAKGDSLAYATYAGGSWFTEMVDEFLEPGQFSDIAVDASDNAHVCYYEEWYYQPKYATNASGGWAVEALENRMTFAGRFCSIALDSFDHVHISYCDADSRAVKYATNASGAWVIEVVDDDVGSNGGRTSIAVDPLGHVHISYNAHGDLRYATNASGWWVTQDVDTASLVRGLTSIAVGASGRVHISYSDNTYGNQALKYATNASGVWVSETLDTSQYSIGSHNAIVVDSFSHVHISYGYYDGTEFDLKYVSNASGSWVKETVDSEGDVGSYSSIAVDSGGTVHISYVDDTNGSLKLACKAIEGYQAHCEPDQVNDVFPSKSWGCGVPPCGFGSLFQSFTPSESSLGAVDLQLRAGGSFPATQYPTTTTIRSGAPNGAVLGTATTLVAGPLATGAKPMVRFQFRPEIVVTPGDTYVIDWVCPEEGGSVLTWTAATGNPYPGGTAFGCGGSAITGEDFIFTTYAQVNTVEGESIAVEPTDPTTGMAPVCLTFEQVAQAGNTSLVTGSSGPALPSGLQLGSPPTYYDLTTTAGFDEEVDICVNYSGVDYLNEQYLGLFQYEGGIWQDTTTWGDKQNNVICGTTGSFSDFAIVEPTGIPVEIDIKPGGYPNTVNLKSKGKVPVAVLTTAEFDASSVDETRVFFAGAEPVRSTLKDVDKDGDLDMLFHFETQALDLNSNSTQASLAGHTTDEEYFVGTDTVKIVP